MGRDIPHVDMPGEPASMAANILGASRAPLMATACHAARLLPQVWPPRAVAEGEAEVQPPGDSGEAAPERGWETSGLCPHGAESGSALRWKTEKRPFLPFTKESL